MAVLIEQTPHSNTKYFNFTNNLGHSIAEFTGSFTEKTRSKKLISIDDITAEIGREKK